MTTDKRQLSRNPDFEALERALSESRIFGRWRPYGLRDALINDGWAPEDASMLDMLNHEAPALLSRLRNLEEVAVRASAFLQAETVFHATPDMGDAIEVADSALTEAKIKLEEALLVANGEKKVLLEKP